MSDATDSAALKPACVQCTRRWSKEHQLPAIIPVDSAIVMRDLARGVYCIIAHCSHGRSARERQSVVIDLGAETPSDNKIRTARAFAA